MKKWVMGWKRELWARVRVSMTVCQGVEEGQSMGRQGQSMALPATSGNDRARRGEK